MRGIARTSGLPSRPMEPSQFQKASTGFAVSPKSGTPLAVTHGNELKVVYPQETDPRSYAQLNFEHFFIQPKDGDHASDSLRAPMRFCSENPKWRLSLQTHKLAAIR